eukprot:4874173-Alexandrium_andersonii.AAC.1
MAMQKSMIGDCIEAEINEPEAEINERIMEQAVARGSGGAESFRSERVELSEKPHDSSSPTCC